MPNKKAQEKSVRQSKKHNLRNKTAKTRLRTELKKLRSIVEAKNGEEAGNILAKTISIINKTAEKGIIHKRKAARLESRLTKKVNALQATAKK